MGRLDSKRGQYDQPRYDETDEAAARRASPHSIEQGVHATRPEDSLCRRCGVTLRPTLWHPNPDKASHWEERGGVRVLRRPVWLRAPDYCSRCERRQEQDDWEHAAAGLLSRHGAEFPSDVTDSPDLSLLDPRETPEGYPTAVLAPRLESVADLERWLATECRRTGRFGVHGGNHAAWNDVRTWSPSMARGAGGWLWIHGPVGTGKTTMIGAHCRDLARSATIPARLMVLRRRPIPKADIAQAAGLAVAEEVHRLWMQRKHLPPSDRLSDRPDLEKYTSATRGRAYPASYTTWDELMDRQSMAWEGDRSPMHKLSQSPLLVVDELDDADPKRWLPVRRQALWKLIEKRYRDRKPLVLISNDHPDDLLRVWANARLESRLREMCRIAHVRGPDVRGVAW